MEATIIRLDNVGQTTPIVVRSATFEEAFGDFSEARGRGRARRKKRRLERIRNRREVRTERRKLRADRQQERIERRRARKRARQEMRSEQQEARMSRRQRRLQMRQERQEARQERKNTRSRGEQERENYELEQQNYRDSISPREEEGGSDDQQGGGGFDDQQSEGGSDDQQGGGGFDDQQGGGYSDDQQGGGYSDDWASAPQGYYDEEDYDDSEMYDSPYVQEESEFADDSYFNVEGMDGKGAVLPAPVSEDAQKLMNNQRAYRDLTVRKMEMARVGNNTKGIDIRLQKCRRRVQELKQKLDKFVNADGNPNEVKRRKNALATKLGLKRRRRKCVQYGGSEVPVQKELNAEISKQRIVVPPSSNFDAYSDLGRPVIVNGVTQSDYYDYSNDLLTDSEEPTTIDLFSNADGNTKNNTNTIISVVVGIGIGALAIYVAKRKGWI